MQRNKAYYFFLTLPLDLEDEREERDDDDLCEEAKTEDDFSSRVPVSKTGETVSLYVNGSATRHSLRDFGHFGTGATDVTYWTISLNIIEELDATDTVKVRIYQSGGATQAGVGSQAGYTWWSGYLLG